MNSASFRQYFKGALFLFLSGFSGFSLELLFVRKLRLVLGSTTYSFALTLIAVFVGFSLGSYFWGKKSGLLKNPARVSGFLQVGSIVFAFLSLTIINTFPLVANISGDLFERSPLFFRIILAFLLTLVLLPWSFCWGGVLPIAVQYTQYDNQNKISTSPTLYTMTLVGGCVGIAVVLFGLLPEFGFFRSFLIACGTGLIAGFLVLITPLQRSWEYQSEELGEKPVPLHWLPLLTAFVSGLCTIGLEILWLRIFSLVDQNSVFTVGMILIVFNSALVVGSFIIVAIRKKSWPLDSKLFAALIASSLLVFITPFVFIAVTEGILPLLENETWLGSLFNLVTTALPILFLPSLAVGLIFPLLLSSDKGHSNNEGRVTGYLVAVNTIGTIIGAFFFGFISDVMLGLWNSLFLVAGIYCGIALLFSVNNKTWSKLWKITLVVIMTIIAVSACFIHLPLMGKNISGRGLKVIESRESAGCAVAIVSNDIRMHLLINNQYSLGSNTQIDFKQSQALLPLLLHMDPKKLCFIGLGTGITAGAALSFPVDSVVVCEIVPAVVTLAKKYFSQYTSGLFSDPRVTIRPEDGRNYLTWTGKNFDVIMADLFIPWQSGAGTLYTVEYFNTVKNRLNSNGIFAQWLPLYQLSEQDYRIIEKTLRSVFPCVTMWRLNFDYQEPVVVLIASSSSVPVDPILFNSRIAKNPNGFSPLFKPFQTVSAERQDFHLIYSLYCGNLSAMDGVPDDLPLNSDDFLPIEFKTPKTKLNKNSDHRFTGEHYVTFCRNLESLLPSEKDPFCSNLDSCTIGYIKIGRLSLQQAFSSGKETFFWGQVCEEIVTQSCGRSK